MMESGHAQRRERAGGLEWIRRPQRAASHGSFQKFGQQRPGITRRQFKEDATEFGKPPAFGNDKALQRNGFGGRHLPHKADAGAQQDFLQPGVGVENLGEARAVGPGHTIKHGSKQSVL